MNRTVLVTGANRGIGLALTQMLLNQGAQLHATTRHPESSAALKRLLESYPQQLTIHALDLSDEQAIYQLAEKLDNTPIDWLLSNAGIYGPPGMTFGAVETAGWLETFRINTIAPMHLMQAFWAHVSQSQEKKIGILSSKVGSMGDNFSGGGYVYRSSKAAVNAVIKSASLDLARQGVNVAALHPGWVRTDMGGPQGEISPAESAERLCQIMDGLSQADRGRFIDIDNTTIPW